MTAKEMLERARSYTELTSTAYYFNGDELMQFVSQLCKEQRELCANVFRERSRKYDNYEQYTNVLIQETKQPEIFEDKNS